VRLPKWPVKMIATAKRYDKSPIFIKLNRKNNHYLHIWSHKKQSLVREISSAQAPKDMFVTGRPRPWICYFSSSSMPRPTGLAGRHLFENCQVCRKAPSEPLDAEILEILAWRSKFGRRYLRWVFKNRLKYDLKSNQIIF
jgi:hypothetical protein